MSNPTLISSNTQRHVPLRGMYTTRTLAELSGRIIGESSRMRGFSFVAETPGVDLTLGPGDFVSVGQALDLSLPTREAGIIVRTEGNSVIDITGFTNPYVYGFAPNTDEGTAIQFLVTEAAAAPNSQYAPIIKKIAGQWILDPAIGNDALYDETQDVRVDSGASQFFLTPTAPGTVTITGASLPNGTAYAGNVGFTGNPAFTNGATNYIWFNTSTALIENNTTGFLAGTDYLRLWILTLDGSGNVTSLVDRRPWFSPMAGAGGGGGGVDEGPGTFLQADLTTLGNQHPKPAVIYSEGSQFTWNATTSTLSWNSGGGTEVQLRFTDELSYVNNILIGTPLSPIAESDVVYADLNRAGGNITAQISVGTHPAPALNRVIIGRRISGRFVMTNGQILTDSSVIAGGAPASVGFVGLSKDRWQAIQGNPSSPTAANYFLTLADQQAMVLDDLADVSTNGAAAFNAAEVAGATGVNRLAVLSDITGITGLKGANAGTFTAGVPLVLTHSFGSNSAWIMIYLTTFGGGGSNTSATFGIWAFRRATGQIYGISQSTPGGVFGVSGIIHNGTVVVLGSPGGTNIGWTGFASANVFILGHSGTTITLYQNTAGIAIKGLVVGFG